MTSEKKAPPTNSTAVLEQTVKTLASLNNLITEATSCSNDSSLIFHILNHTVSYIYYDRAILITANGKKVLGVSGTSNHSKHSLLATNLQKLPKLLKNSQKSQIITDDSLIEIPSFWKEYKESSDGTSLLWLPLSDNNDEVTTSSSNEVVLILERWNRRQWRESDLKLTAPLQKSFSGLFTLHRKSNKNSIKKKGRKVFWLFILISLLLFMFSYRVQERIVAPCEVAPENPASVTTAIDGVIADVMVTPGQQIESGQPLIRLNDEIFSEDLTAAGQQVKITRSELARTQAQAVNSLEARSKLITLENQLKMDQTRLRIAQYKIDKSLIDAPTSGIVMMADPHEWEGKPVMTGERIMLIITPSKNKIKIYLPMDDKIDFPENAPVKIILNTDSATSREASLYYLSDHATMSPEGIPSFLAEARFKHTVTDVRMGVQGTAVIYGRKVSLGYWLIRRPLAAFRNFTGI